VTDSIEGQWLKQIDRLLVLLTQPEDDGWRTGRQTNPAQPRQTQLNPEGPIEGPIGPSYWRRTAIDPIEMTQWQLLVMKKPRQLIDSVDGQRQWCDQTNWPSIGLVNWQLWSWLTQLIERYWRMTESWTMTQLVLWWTDGQTQLLMTQQSPGQTEPMKPDDPMKKAMKRNPANDRTTGVDSPMTQLMKADERTDRARPSGQPDPAQDPASQLTQWRKWQLTRTDEARQWQPDRLDEARQEPNDNWMTMMKSQRQWMTKDQTSDRWRMNINEY